MPKLFNLVRQVTATTGTAPSLTLGSAVPPFLTAAQAGAVDGDVVSYAIIDGVANSEIGFGQLSSSATGLTRNVTKSTNANAAINLSGSAQVIITPRAEDFVVPHGLISGLTLSAAGSTATFGVAAGQATDGDHLGVMALASAYTKTTGAWAVGSGNGAMDTGTVANNTWYHVWLIQRSDTGVVDILFSLSASAPTMPAAGAYNRKRRLGSMKTDGSAQWIKFFQTDDEFLWAVPTLDVNAGAPTTTPALSTLNVPTGVKVIALSHVNFTNTASTQQSILAYSPDVHSQSTGTPIGNQNTFNQAANAFITFDIRLLTNTSAQIYFVTSAAANNQIFVVTFGWIDRRGR